MDAIQAICLTRVLSFEQAPDPRIQRRCLRGLAMPCARDDPPGAASERGCSRAPLSSGSRAQSHAVSLPRFDDCRARTRSLYSQSRFRSHQTGTRL